MILIYTHLPAETNGQAAPLQSLRTVSSQETCKKRCMVQEEEGNV